MGGSIRAAIQSRVRTIARVTATGNMTTLYFHFQPHKLPLDVISVTSQETRGTAVPIRNRFGSQNRLCYAQLAKALVARGPVRLRCAHLRELCSFRLVVQHAPGPGFSQIQYQAGVWHTDLWINPGSSLLQDIDNSECFAVSIMVQRLHSSASTPAEVLPSY